MADDLLPVPPTWFPRSDSLRAENGDRGVVLKTYGYSFETPEVGGAITNYYKVVSFLILHS